MPLVELLRHLPLPRTDQLQIEVGEHGVEQLGQLGLEGVRGLGDPELKKLGCLVVVPHFGVAVSTWGSLTLNLEYCCSTATGSAAAAAEAAANLTASLADVSTPRRSERRVKWDRDIDWGRADAREPPLQEAVEATSSAAPGAMGMRLWLTERERDDGVCKPVEAADPYLFVRYSTKQAGGGGCSGGKTVAAALAAAVAAAAALLALAGAPGGALLLLL